MCSNIEASSLAKPLPLRSQSDEISPINIDDDTKDLIDSNRKNIFIRSADTDNNYVDDEENDDQNKNKEEDENTQSPHPHGSHGPLGHVKILLNHVQQGGGIHALGNSIGTHNLMPNNNHHESAIETNKDRTTTNAGAGLHVLEFLGSIFGLIWGFISNIPALFGSSSSASSSGRQ